MAFNVGDLVARLRLDGGNFEKGLARAQTRVREFGDEANRLTGTMSRLGAVAFAGFAANAVRAGAQMDSLRRGMTAVMGSADAARKEIVRLQETAKLPGLGFKEAIQGSTALQAAGASAELARRSLEAFGNAIASVGGGKAELDGVTLALSQILAQGTVLGQEIRQIAQRVPQVRVAMQKAFGTARSEEIQKLNISAEEFIDRISTQLATLPKVTGGLRNLGENIADAFFRASAAIGEGLAPALEEGGVSVQNLLGDMEEFGNGLKRNGPIIGAWGRFAVEVFKTLALAIAAPIRLLFNLGEQFGEVGRALAALLRGDMRGFIEAGKNMRRNWADMGAALNGVIDGFDGMRIAAGDALGTVQDESEQAADELDNANESAAELEATLRRIASIRIPTSGQAPSLAISDIFPGMQSRNILARGGNLGFFNPLDISQLPLSRQRNLSPRAFSRTLGGALPQRVEMIGPKPEVVTGTDTALRRFTNSLNDGAASFTSFVKENLDPREFVSNLGANLVGGAINSLYSAAANAIVGVFDNSEVVRMLRENSRALDRLRTSVERQGEVVSGTAGGKLSAALQALENIWWVGNPQDLSDAQKITAAVNDELASVGLTMEDFKDILASMGIEFHASLTQMGLWVDALRELQVSDAFAGFAGQLGLLRQEFDLFDFTPVQQLQKMRTFLLNQANLPTNVASGLRGLDLGTAAGRAALETQIQNIFRMIQGGELTLGDLGNLSAPQFLDFLNSLESLVDQIDGTTDAFRELHQELSNVPTGFKIARALYGSDTGIVSGSPIFNAGGGGGVGDGGMGEIIMGGGGTKVDTVVIQVSSQATDPRQVAQETAEVFERWAAQGGSSAFTRAVVRANRGY